MPDRPRAAAASPGLVDAAFAQRMVGVHGAAGAAWVAQLPALLAEYAARWSLTLLPPFTPLTYNYVAPVLRRDGQPAVLKAGVPGRELQRELAALRWFAGQGSVRVLAAAAAQGVFLLERLLPGTPLLSHPSDEQATAIAIAVMQRLWRPPPTTHPFPTVADLGAGWQRLRAHFGGGAGPLSERLVTQAERLFAELTATQAAPVLLHGDLHHGNILAAEREPWLAIDPQGVIGEPAYEVGAWLRNPYPQMAAWPAVRAIQARRLAQFSAALGCDRQRVLGWGFVQAVLSAWWMIEDHEANWQPDLAMAEVLASL